MIYDVAAIHSMPLNYTRHIQDAPHWKEDHGLLYAPLRNLQASGNGKPWAADQAMTGEDP